MILEDERKIKEVFQNVDLVNFLKISCKIIKKYYYFVGLILLLFIFINYFNIPIDGVASFTIFLTMPMILIWLVWYIHNKLGNSKNDVFDWYFPITGTTLTLFMIFMMFIIFYTLNPSKINIFPEIISNVSYPYFTDNSSVEKIMGTTFENDTIRDYLSNIASGLISMNSIIITITTLIIQHVSDKRGTILMDLFFKDLEILGFYWSKCNYFLVVSIRYSYDSSK